jgi:hypothetical protein
LWLLALCGVIEKTFLAELSQESSLSSLQTASDRSVDSQVAGFITPFTSDSVLRYSGQHIDLAQN